MIKKEEGIKVDEFEDDIYSEEFIEDLGDDYLLDSEEFVRLAH